MILRLLVVLLPWSLKRRVLQRWWGYDLHPESRIGLSWVFPAELFMSAGAKIDHFVVAVHLDRIEVEQNSKIGRRNWITGFPTGTGSEHFAHQPDRQSALLLGAESAITKNHHIDCTHTVTIGKFVTVAGYGTQILTHSIDIAKGRQHSVPIFIGDYCFVGTNSVLLGGAGLPHHSVLGANSVLTKAFSEPFTLYAGNPAGSIKPLARDGRYFTRKRGYVI